MSIQPTQPVIDPAQIGPDDLWAVWVRSPAFLRQAGVSEVSIRWLLAAPGSDGLGRIASGFKEDFVTAFPLTLLRHIGLTAPVPAQSGHLPKWVRTALGAKETLLLVRDKAGSSRIVSTQDELRAGETVLARGSRRDFDDILNEGERILRNKDWTKIFSDVRPFVVPGTVGWLSHARNPKGAAALEAIMERLANGGS